MVDGMAHILWPLDPPRVIKVAVGRKFHIGVAESINAV